MSDEEYDVVSTRQHRHIRVEKPEYIICAANWYADGIQHEHKPANLSSGYVICGRRHHNIFQIAALLDKENTVKRNNVCEQGFMTSTNRWVDRKTAAEIAFAAGQIKKKTPILFSEDIY